MRRFLSFREVPDISVDSYIRFFYCAVSLLMHLLQIKLSF